METKPNFLIVGAAKSGTTSIYHYLSRHPGVFLARIKEPCFFTAEKPESEWVRTWEDYLALFKDAGPFKWRGEASTPYLHYYQEVIPQVLERLNPCKIIAVLRNPVQRAYSLYGFNRVGLREPLDFEAALEAEEMRIKNKWQAAFHYKKIGFSADALQAYKDAFGDPNVCVLLYDDLRADANGFMQKIYSFLDIPTVTMTHARIHNASGIPKNPQLHALLYRKALWKEPLKLVLPKAFRQNLKEKIMGINLEKQEMAEETKRKLIALYAGEISKLEDLTGRDLSHWRRG